MRSSFSTAPAQRDSQVYLSIMILAWLQAILNIMVPGYVFGTYHTYGRPIQLPFTALVTCHSTTYNK